MVNRWGEKCKQQQILFSGLQNHCRWWLKPWNWKKLAPSKKSYDKPRQCIKKQRHHFADKGLYSQTYGFSSSHVWMWELDHKEGWAPENWCFQTVVLEKTLEIPFDSKEIKPVNPKGNQPWTFIGRADGWRWSSNNLASWCEEVTHCKRPQWWERLRAGGEEGGRVWDG